jgi:hypothetical protein
MPAQAIAATPHAVGLQQSIILQRPAIVASRTLDIEPDTVLPSLGRTFEAAEQIASVQP